MKQPDPPRLVMQAVRRSLQSHDQAVFNNKFPIFAYYRIGMLCARFTADEIPDIHYAGELHYALLKARKEGDRTKIMRYTSLLRQERHKVEPIIKRFLDRFQNATNYDESRPEVYDTHSLGVLSHEDIE